MEESIKMSRKERRHYLGYLLAMYLGATILLTLIIFFGVSNPFSPISDADREQLKQAQLFTEKQRQASVIYDSVMARITVLETMPENQVLRTDVENRIGYLNSLNDRDPNLDMRTAGLHQMSMFLNKHLQSAVILKGQIKNIETYQQRLNNCKVSYNKNQDHLNQVRAAQAGR